jgi:bacterioferritin (cytochrome b1)
MEAHTFNATGGRMNSEKIFIDALEYEKRVRDMYFEAMENVDDSRGKELFRALGDDEQSHVDFLEYSLETLKSGGAIDIDRLETAIPSKEMIAKHVAAMTDRIPGEMLGNVKRLLNSALSIEVETSTYYRGAIEKTEGEIQAIFKKFLGIEERHVEVVQIELDCASNNGFWFNFMEIDLED